MKSTAQKPEKSPKFAFLSLKWELTDLRVCFYYIITVKSTLPKRLERLFADLGVNQMSFARRTGYGQSYISQLLSGNKPSPSERFYKTVGREFNVNPEWLKTGKGRMYAMPGGTGGDETAEVFAKFHLLPKSEQRLIEDMINALLVKSMDDKE